MEFRSASKQLSARLRDLCLHSFLATALPKHCVLTCGARVPTVYS